ncbi:MAG: TIGR02300 family protein [Rhodospirillales bacterium]|nr:TIGR02300 family protein [Rhodospirillales bacterium]MSP80850.1 TIGR02300 family protein [Rhodospirillales bacterium]
MSKPEWGTKRTCQGCGVRFYDLNRAQVICPKCGTANTAAPPAKLRRAAAKPVEPVRPIPPVAVEASLVAEEGPAPDLGEDKDVEDKDEEEEVIEDASDLGEGEDDVAEVKEHIEPESGR